MNAWQRFRAALHDGGPTEIPCWPQAYLYAVNHCAGGMPVYCTDARAFADAQLRAREAFGYDGVGAGPDITMEAESLGADIVIPQHAEPYIARAPVSGERDVATLRVPDVRTSGRLRMVIEATEMLAGRVKGEVPVFCQLRSPFVLAANLVGVEQIMMAVYRSPALVGKLVRFCTEFCETYGLALREAGADVLEIGNAVAGMLSAELYREFAADPLKLVVERFRQAGAIVAIHMCGKTAHVMDQMIASSADILEIDYPLSIPELVQRYGRPVTWLGNIHPVEVLLHGPAERVRAESLALLRQMGRGGRFILSPGCEPSILTPAEHLRALVEACREFNGAFEDAGGVPPKEAQAS